MIYIRSCSSDRCIEHTAFSDLVRIHVGCKIAINRDGRYQATVN